MTSVWLGGERVRVELCPLHCLHLLQEMFLNIGEQWHWKKKKALILGPSCLSSIQGQFYFIPAKSNVQMSSLPNRTALGLWYAGLPPLL